MVPFYFKKDGGIFYLFLNRFLPLPLRAANVFWARILSSRSSSKRSSKRSSTESTLSRLLRPELVRNVLPPKVEEREELLPKEVAGRWGLLLKLVLGTKLLRLVPKNPKWSSRESSILFPPLRKTSEMSRESRPRFLLKKLSSGESRSMKLLTLFGLLLVLALKNPSLESSSMELDTSSWGCEPFKIKS